MRNHTSIALILDKSGSMHPVREKTIEGVNTFIINQKKIGLNADLTLILFDTYIAPLWTAKPLEEINYLSSFEYEPAGSTALLDAIGIGIDTLGRRLAAMLEQERPDKVLFAIMTDGQENSSREYSRDRIRQSIEHQNSKYNWEFIFLAADINGVTDAENMGIKRDRITNYQGIENLDVAMKRLNTATTSYRNIGRI